MYLATCKQANPKIRHSYYDVMCYVPCVIIAKTGTSQPRRQQTPSDSQPSKTLSPRVVLGD